MRILLMFFGTFFVGNSACASPSGLILAFSKERSDSIARFVSYYRPETKGQETRTAIVGNNDSKAILKELEEAEKIGVKFIGIDGSIMHHQDVLVQAKLKALWKKGLLIDFAKEKSITDGWPDIVALAERATRCQETETRDFKTGQFCFHQVNDQTSGLNVAHKLDLSGPTTILNGGSLKWKKERLTMMYSRLEKMEGTSWFVRYDLAGTLVQKFKTRIYFDENGKERSKQELIMDSIEAEEMAKQEFMFWHGWKKQWIKEKLGPGTAARAWDGLIEFTVPEGWFSARMPLTPYPDPESAQFLAPLLILTRGTSTNETETYCLLYPNYDDDGPSSHKGSFKKMEEDIASDDCKRKGGRFVEISYPQQTFGNSWKMISATGLACNEKTPPSSVLIDFSAADQRYYLTCANSSPAATIELLGHGRRVQ